MEDRHRVGGNPSPSSNPEPSVPSAQHGTENTLREGSWDAPDFVVPGAGEPGTEPIPTEKRHEQRNPGGWSPSRFRVPGNPSPSTNPGQEP